MTPLRAYADLCVSLGLPIVAGMSVLPPDVCTNMAEVRAGVDAVDEDLVRLIARRQGYMDAAARIKPERAQVRDDARIEAVLAHVRAAATKAGLSHNIAEPVWRALIEACIAYELEVFDRMRR